MAVVCNCSRMLAGTAGTRDCTSKMLTHVAGSNDDSWLGDQLGCQPSTDLYEASQARQFLTQRSFPQSEHPERNKCKLHGLSSPGPESKQWHFVHILLVIRYQKPSLRQGEVRQTQTLTRKVFKKQQLLLRTTTQNNVEIILNYTFAWGWVSRERN